MKNEARADFNQLHKDSAIWDSHVLEHFALLGTSDGLLRSQFILIMVPIIDYIHNLMEVG